MTDPAATQRKNRRTMQILLGVALGMFGFGFALVPLYGLLCQVTGVQSVEQRSSLGQAPEGGGETASSFVQGARTVTVKFDATVHPELPWSFTPLERKLEVQPGEVREVRFLAQNRSSRPVTGQALPSIAPWQATGFFNKMECFCFSQQTLQGGESKEMPLRFAISPDLPADIQSLTLSYSFLRTAEPDSAAEKLAGN